MTHEPQCRALVLNSSYQPLKSVSWQKAFVLWFQDKVEVVEFHTITVRSARQAFKIPSVLRLKRYIGPKRRARIKFSRDNIYLRDNYTCQYCGLRFTPKELTLDHVVPASRAGKKDWTNVVTACRPCNHRKANRTPLGAGMPLLSEPRIPSWLPHIYDDFAVPEVDRVPDEWRPYLIAVQLKR